MARYDTLVIGGLLALASFSASAADIWDSQFLNDRASRVINRTGGPASLGFPYGGTTINSGTGGALITVRQPLNVNGSKAALTLAREITPANIAKVGLKAARLLGPVGIASLAVEVVEWVGDKWIVRELEGVCYRNAQGAEACSASEAVANYNLTQPSDRTPGELWQSEWGQPVVSVCSARYTGQLCVQWSKSSEGTEVQREATDPELEQAIRDGLMKPAQYAKASAVLDAAVQAVQSLRDVVNELAGPTKVSGPESILGPSETVSTQTPTGTEVTTTTTSYPLSYVDNSVTVNSTTTITHPDNSVTIITNNGGDGEPEPPEQGLCDQYPEIVACQKLGELEPEQIERKTVPLSMEPESGFGPATAQCPADVQFSWQGTQLGMSWGPICSFAEGIRPVVIAVAWLSAALGFFAFARKGD